MIEHNKKRDKILDDIAHEKTVRDKVVK